LKASLFIDEDDLFTAISPLMVGDYTRLEKKKLVILYALFLEKGRLGSEKVSL